MDPILIPTHEQIAATFDKAADLMEANGYTKFIRLNSSGAMCALGALEKAHHGRIYFNDHAMQAHIITLARKLELPRAECNFPSEAIWQKSADIAEWSNSTDKETVVEGFRRAARLLRG